MWDSEAVERRYFFPRLHFQDISANTPGWFMLDNSAIWKVFFYLLVMQIYNLLHREQ